MIMRKALFLLLPLAGALVFTSFSAKAETTLRWLSAWAANNPNIPNVETPLIKSIEAASKGEIKIQRSGPEVASPFQQLQPVSAGVFDVLFTTPGYHQAQTGIGMSFDTIKGDVKARRESGIVAKADEFYRKKFGLAILAVHSAPGIHFVLREGLADDGTLKGLKIRANATFQGLVSSLGGTPVNMSPADAYSSMQKGELDGITFPAFASADYKLYEVGKYMTRPVFGLTDVLILINVKKLESLSPELQKAIMEEGKKIEPIGKAALDKLQDNDEARMKENGVKIIKFKDELVPKLAAAYNEGIRMTASKSSPDETKALWELAKSKNMLNQ